MKQKQRKRWLSLLAALLLLPALAACGPGAHYCRGFWRRSSGPTPSPPATGAHIPTEEPPEL